MPDWSCGRNVTDARAIQRLAAAIAVGRVGQRFVRTQLPGEFHRRE